MATVPSPDVSPFVTFGHVVASLPDIPLARIRLDPKPGTATEADVIHIRNSQRVLCELFDGVLVEKPVGHNESILAGYILTAINVYLDQLGRDIGRVAGEASMLHLAPGQLRMPDVSFVSKSQFVGGVYPTTPIWNAYPDLAVEVLSDSNTTTEIARKINEYFAAGTRLVWVVDPTQRVVTTFDSPRDAQTLTVADQLKGDPVLPGFTLPVSRIFRG
jgi:Uma2 family endonuclease